MRRISVQPSSSTNNNNNNNEKIINNNNNTIRSLSPNNIGTPSKPPTTPSHIINKKKLIVEKQYKKTMTYHPYYPLDYWFIFFLGFLVSYLIFTEDSSNTSDNYNNILKGTSKLSKHNNNKYYQKLLLREKELINANNFLKHTVNTLQSRLEMECNHDMKQTTNVEKQMMTLKTELEGAKEFARHATDTKALTNAMEKAILNARSSALEVDTMRKKLLNMKSSLPIVKTATMKEDKDSTIKTTTTKITENNNNSNNNKNNKNNQYDDNLDFKKNMILKSVSKRNDFDLSRWSIWDVPLTELYRYWNWPPGPIGSIIYDQWVLGVTEENTVESKQVVAFAIKAMSNLPIFKKANVIYTMDSLEKEKKIEVIRFERRIERFYGIHFTVHIRIKDSGEVYAIHSRRPLQKLKLENIVSMQKERPKLVNIIVSVSNRGKALLKMIKSLLPFKDGIRLVVVDHTSTDANLRVMLRKSGLTNYKFLWAPKSMKKFSRALMLDYGIRSLKDDEIFFTCDVDMHVPHNLHEIVALTVEKGARVYAPEVFQLKDGYKLKATAKSGSFFGWGYGMIGAYKSDYVNINGYDLKKFRYGWGGEDIDLINRFVRHGYTIIRPREHELLHRWHKKLSWRKESQCDFHWRKGTFCATSHDKHSDNINHNHTWTFKLSFLRNCDYDQDKDLLGQHAASIDIPAGKYEMKLLSKLPKAIEMENKTALSSSMPPQVHLKATHADLADEVMDGDDQLFNLTNIVLDNLDAKTNSIIFETSAKATRIYLWVSPCNLDERREETEGEVVNVALINV